MAGYFMGYYTIWLALVKRFFLSRFGTFSVGNPGASVRAASLPARERNLPRKWASALAFLPAAVRCKWISGQLSIRESIQGVCF